MFKSTYNTIIILFLVLRVQAQQIIYQPLIFNNIEPVWQHAPIDSSLIGINNFDGRNHFTISKNPSCYVLFEDNLYIAPSTATTEFGVDGGFIERINTITGEVDWINTFDLRSEERQEFIQDLYIDDQRRVNVVSFRRIVEPIPDPYFVWIENGDSSIISIRKYDIETGELLEHKTPDFTDYQSLRLRHQVNNARFFKGDKKGNFQYIEKEKKSGFVLKQYYLDENGYQIGQMNQDSMVFSNPNSWSSNSILPILVVNKDTIVALSFLIRQSSTESGQSRLTIYDQNLKKRHEFFLDDLIEDNYKSLLLNYADKDFIYLQVVYWLGPTEEVYNEHIIMDYEGKIIKRFETIQDGLYYFPFIITYLEKENEF
ncbi:MAG TPA: hypothetical protein PLU49_14280, partial [Saprospiraceae bacterium]|nr:hypothetical protein [Saprospiraceae bacterium]